MPRVDYDKLTSDKLSEPSVSIRERGEGVYAGASVGPAKVRQECEVNTPAKSLLRTAMQQLQMSARAYHRILKLSRTIADLAGSSGIRVEHVAEAIQYRPRRQF